MNLIWWRLTVSGVRDVLRRPFGLVATVGGVVAIVYLCGLVALVARAVDATFARDQGQVRFQVYWQPGADSGLVARQMDWMRALPGLVDTRSFTPQQALSALSGSLGQDIDLSAFAGRNPLPYTMLLTFRPPVLDAGFARDMYDRLKAVEGVAEVRYDPRELDKAVAIGLFVRRIVLPLAGVLALLVGLVVGNTVRLSLLRQRDELEILRLVGASEWHIRWPLTAGAAAMGLVGAVAAVGLLKLTQVALVAVLDVPPLFIRLPFLPAWLTVSGIVLAGAIAGLAGWAAALESRP